MKLTRREVLAGAAGAAFAWRIPLDLEGPAKTLRIAAITDLHHGLAPDAMTRLTAFGQAVESRENLDLVMQMGDFCYSNLAARECSRYFNGLPHDKIHVLGNHDMDKVDKTLAVKFFGMPHRYYSKVVNGWRIVVLDLNNFKKEGKMFHYADGNYFTSNATLNMADPEQLAWLDQELRTSKEPVILISHQPLGFKEPGGKLPPEQIEVLDVVTKARKENPRGAVQICLFGHLHVDRLEHHEGIPCLCLNSASYFWSEGMVPYSNPLFAFLEFNRGELIIEGRMGEFLKQPPKSSDQVIGRSASIQGRKIAIS